MKHTHQMPGVHRVHSMLSRAHLPGVCSDDEEKQQRDEEHQHCEDNNGHQTEHDVAGILEANHFTVIEPMLDGEREGEGEGGRGERDTPNYITDHNTTMTPDLLDERIPNPLCSLRWRAPSSVGPVAATLQSMSACH